MTRLRRVLSTSTALIALAAAASCGGRRPGATPGRGTGMPDSGLAFRAGVTAVEPSAEVRAAAGQTIYVPVYSHIYTSHDANPFHLAATLSVRNTDQSHPIILTSVGYYDSDGRLVRDYLERRLRLAPLASMEFFVAERDTRGGAGANFLVGWVAERPVSDPIVEVVMIGTSSNQGISFVCSGRVVADRTRTTEGR
jgi:hypothetical protein